MVHTSEKNPICILGIDLGKNSFQLHGLDAERQIVYQKKLNREKLKAFMVTLPACLVAMEACGSAHYWGRLFQDYGHQVKLIAPQFVKPYVKSNKNNAADAEAICEAAQRPNMRFVSIKTVEQQDLQSVHRMRSLAVSSRTALINQTRGLLQEYGLDVAQGPQALLKALPLFLEDAENRLTPLFRELLQGLYEALKQANKQVDDYNQRVAQLGQQSEQAKRLQTIPGVGPVTATALVAAIGSVSCFKNGRELAAWLGLVPRQHSTGGRDRLLGISKRGNVYLRCLLIHGARSALRHMDNKTDKRSLWVLSVMQRRHNNVAAVALANKMARTVFALLKTGESYQSVQPS